ncbi:diguanylate cyclase [Chitinivorax sp. PXF-14]|uniref:diguanylate cyclase n=1 Tax=Chitinivorax sp. PXF-14 TaxID=3230488 RepID=UPI003466D857
MKLAGYTIRDVIYSIDETVIAQAEDEAGEPVVLKYHNTPHPSLELRARWQHEHEVLKRIDSDWVIKTYGLRQVDNIQVLALESFSATNLSQLAAHNRLSFAERIRIAIQLACALSDVHRHGLIHCDISAKNVLVDTATLRVKLCDFGMSTRLDREPRQAPDSYPRGTLEYISPEQTGRTNLEVDYRSDFYSMGVTLYELFLGTRPFVSDDTAALLHAHLALLPTPLHEADPAIPRPLSDVVQKLLAKYPDDRYQSSHGLMHDLQHCLTQWQTQRRIEPFTLAAADVPERFCVSHKLYGREAECTAILAAFERTSRGRAELLLVSGYSGIGKTSLVNLLHKPVVARRGYFIRGKCDQYRRNQPYAGLIQAFQPLISTLTSEGGARLAYWQQRLARALGDHAAAVTAILPSLAQIIGEPAPLQPLPAAELENRFHIAFRHLIDALASREQPLLLFLDDLQWADQSTLKLVQQLVADDHERSLLIVGAYRDNEVGDGHPLRAAITAIGQVQGVLHQLRLDNLRLEHVEQLIADTLRDTPAHVAPLAALCMEKTQGNPFFLNQFLLALHDGGAIRYDRDAGAWQWDMADIRRREMTDNVVELMLDKLRQLDLGAQSLLSLAAHLGGSFDMRQLALVSRHDAGATAALLWPALQAGLVVPLDEDYKFDQMPERLARSRYRFLHDRVQQAAHSLTPESERAALQLETGRLLLAHTPPEQLDEQLFTILEPLNQAVSLIDDPAERAHLLALNLRGGIKAKGASAYATAGTLLRQARALLADNAWQAAPAQTLSLYQELAEAEYLAGNFEHAEALYPQAIAATDDVIARVTISLVQAEQYLIQGRFAESFPVLLFALGLLGGDFPASEEDAGPLFPQEFARTEALLAPFSHDELLHAGEMSRPEHLLEMRIYFALSYATYQSGRFASFAVDACKLVQTTLRHGQGDLSSIGYVAYVTAMSAMGKPYPECYRMGQLAQAMAEQRDNKYFRLTIYQYFQAFYQHWGTPLRQSFAFLERGLEWGQQGINPLAAGYCALLRSVNKFVYGVPLPELAPECEQGLKFLQQSHQPNTENMLRYGVLQPVLALQGKTLAPLSFDSEAVSSTGFFNGDYATPSIHLALYSSAMLRHTYLLDDHDGWQSAADRLPIVAACLPDSPSMVEATFYRALGQLRWPGDNAEQQLAEAHAACNQFSGWAQGCRDNFEHKQLLLAAEIARVEGAPDTAMARYTEAIDAAKQAGYLACEALANELYARFWLTRQQKQLAASFIQEAYYHYQSWGAQAKCAALEAAWPGVVFRVGEKLRTTSSRSRSSRRISEQNDMLDLQSILKANQLLASEIQLESLLRQMMGVVLENAGAERGAIVLGDEDKLIVEVMGEMARGFQVNYQRVNRPLDEACDTPDPPLPDAIIHYVQRTQETLLLNQPAEDERFSRNHYLGQHRPKSIMCLPIVAQGKLVAVLYLENDLFENAFTAKHQKTLEMLSSQAAISLVNARLYDSLEDKVHQRTEQLRQMSMKDGLTGIANRRSFDEHLDSEWRRALRTGRPIALLMIDIDYFKQYNDHYGHVEGDNCIRSVARTLAESASRGTDFVARYGGEEFAILLADPHPGEAEQVARACLDGIAALGMAHAKSRHGHVSVSIGISLTRLTPALTPDSLIKQADQALYQAKQGGRNRYCVFVPPAAAPG